MYLNTYSASRSGHNFVTSTIKSWFPNEILELNSGENIIISEIGENNCKEGIKVLIIRDFLNWAASYHMMITPMLEKENVHRYNSAFKNLLRVYKELIEEYVESVHFHPDVKIYYNKFRDDKEYRKEICEKLGGEYTEIVLEYIPRAGRGSSFDKDRFQGRASQMTTNTRYKEVDKYPEDFKRILRENIDLFERWKEVFGATEEELEFINSLNN